MEYLLSVMLLEDNFKGILFSLKSIINTYLSAC